MEEFCDPREINGGAEDSKIPAENRLIVFVKNPVRGAVKTRLAQSIGDKAALDLYRCFVSDILATVRYAGYPALAFFHPPEARGAVENWIGGDIVCVPQKGGDLGQRMLDAFQNVLLQSSRAVLIGSDCPDLPPAFLHEAFDALKTCGAVLGPARDGGYYLIGFSSGRFLPAAFCGIKWSGPEVFEATMRVFRKNGVDVHVLPLWSDIDEFPDLAEVCERQKDLPPGGLKTIDYLRNTFRWRHYERELRK